jgi:xanthine dehydrogenase accessory factor
LVREIYRRIASRIRDGGTFAVATLVGARNASPAPPGTSLMVGPDGSFFGNVGAGCHEGELIDAALATLCEGVPRTIDFDLSDDLFDGSACGASLTVAIWSPQPEFADVAARIADGSDDVTFRCASHEVTVPRKRKLIVVGATDLADCLARAAREADFHVTVVDPRAVFASPQRQPNADRLLCAWPQDALPPLLAGAAAVVVLAHDAKIDLPALRAALDSTIPYIGALGSRRSQEARRDALAEFGYGEAQLARVHGPAGLDLGAVTGAQVACSILAEILSTLNACTARPLRETSGAITR